MTKKINLKHEIDVFVNCSNEYDKQDWQKQYTTFANLEQINEKSVHNSENSNFGHIIISSYFIQINSLIALFLCRQIRNQLYIIYKISIFCNFF